MMTSISLFKLMQGIRRINPVILAGLSLLVVILIIYLVFARQFNERQQAQLSTIARLSNPISVPTSAKSSISDTDQKRFFYEGLGYVSHLEEPLKILQSIGRDTGISLSQSSFRYRSIPATNLIAYDITFPVKGTYLAIRQFCEQFLAAVPFASLVEINLKRDSIQSPQLDAKLKFTLYLNTHAVAKSRQGD
ncbi:hypothetical protein [Undibacterium flavidum]|uniref:Type IV pilus assembly protein PilO n=1 Tax=Undibacterium flavidum TaxID=2762297 RepID=A0ABR6YEB3_9BURK|nr:hypothetical protein [Undibacterium flavidum]MBC3874896.1 hypothetical protein [Undibacterium flavidum]